LTNFCDLDFYISVFDLDGRH